MVYVLETRFWSSGFRSWQALCSVQVANILVSTGLGLILIDVLMRPVAQRTVPHQALDAISILSPIPEP